MNLNVIKFLLTVKNGSLFFKTQISTQSSFVIEQLSEFLYLSGYIQSYKKKDALIFLNLSPEKLKSLKLISKPSFKVYLSYKQICSLKTQNKRYIFSTSKGFLSDVDCKRHAIGGMLLFIC
jgi:small subunit ribosomal protein S8